MEDKIYYISNNNIHNINDVEYQITSDITDIAYIGKQTAEGFRIDEEVGLLTLEEIIEIIK